MTFAEQLKQKYFKAPTFNECIQFIKKVIENQVASERFDDECFDIEICDIRAPKATIYNACNARIMIHLPKGEYTREDFKQWFVCEGFVWTSKNEQNGYRLR